MKVVWDVLNTSVGCSTRVTDWLQPTGFRRVPEFCSNGINGVAGTGRVQGAIPQLCVMSFRGALCRQAALVAPRAALCTCGLWTAPAPHSGGPVLRESATSTRHA